MQQIAAALSQSRVPFTMLQFNGAPAQGTAKRADPLIGFAGD
jgi:hypothetical protein